VTIQVIPVEPSIIEPIGYDETASSLLVGFRDGYV
jgi:hypothetical protein